MVLQPSFLLTTSMCLSGSESGLQNVTAQVREREEGADKVRTTPTTTINSNQNQNQNQTGATESIPIHSYLKVNEYQNLN
jgi:hypothetical protein